MVEALSARAARRSSAVALVAAALGVAALAVVEAAVQVAAAVPGRVFLPNAKKRAALI